MAFKKELCEGKVEKRRARMEEDRLSNLPDDLKLHILSSLDTKDALKTLMLSKTWVSLWTWIPVLDLNDDGFNNVNVFDKLVNNVLRLRDQSAKLEQLTFTRLEKPANSKILKTVFDYAFSHGVKQLEAHILEVSNYIYNSRKLTWPVCLDASFESLTSLKLQSEIFMRCPFLGRRSGSFKNLTDLYLARALIRDSDPFSGFPALERLTLNNCDIRTKGETLSVHARNLSELTISGSHNFICCELTTPRLRSFEYEVHHFLPLFRRHEDLHVLNTMVIRCEINLLCQRRMDVHVFENLFSLLCTLNNVKSLELFWSTVGSLSLFRQELVKQSSPLRSLKCLKLDFTYGLKSTKIAEDVKAHLLRNSPEAEVMYNNVNI